MSQKNSQDSKSATKQYPEAASALAGRQPEKISEAVATYATPSEQKLRTATRAVAGIVADDEIWTFVTTNDLLPHLEMAIRLAREIFSDVREMWLSYEPDPELPKFNAVVIWVKAHGTVENLFEQEKKYIRAFNESIPPDFRHQIGLLLGVA